MDANQFKQLIITIVASIGGVGVILGAIFAWLGKVWADRIYLRTSAQYQKDLENLRNAATERRDLINSLLTVISNQRSKSYERILETVELVWKQVLEIREYTRNLIFIHIILPPRAIENATEKVFSSLPNTSFSELTSTVDKIVSEVEKVRPFIGEKLWELFFIYDAFLAGISWKVIEGKANGKLYPWDKDIQGKPDTHLFESLKTVFSEDEISSLIKTPFPVETIKKVLEIKILEEMNQLTLGNKFVDKTIDEYIRFAEISTTQTRNQ